MRLLKEKMERMLRITQERKPVFSASFSFGRPRRFFLQKKMYGQSGIELVFLVSLLFMTVAIGYLAFLDKNAKVADQHILVDSKKISDSVAFEINNAFSQGNGFSKNFTIPANILGYAYSITVNGSFVILDVLDQSFVSKISVSSINGTVSKGKNEVKNLGGTIYVTPA